MTLPKNPLTMLGRIERCWLFTFSVPAAEVRELVPAPLELVTRDDLAFFNIVVSELRHMRPWPLPKLVGLGYRHAALRLYVRVQPPGEEPITGLFFVRSDADRPLIVKLGNVLTDFRFHLATIGIEADENKARLSVTSEEPLLDATLLRNAPELPRNAPFASLAEAVAFLKYGPAGLSMSSSGAIEVVRIRRHEAAWRSVPVTLEQGDFGYVKAFDARHILSFELAPIDYRWQRAERFRVAR
jgi:hypothetical protein